MEVVDMLLHLPNGEEGAVASEVAHLRARILKGGEAGVQRCRNRAQLVGGVEFPRYHRSWRVVALVALVTQQEFAGCHDVARLRAAGKTLCAADHRLRDAVAEAEVLVVDALL